MMRQMSEKGPTGSVSNCSDDINTGRILYCRIASSGSLQYLNGFEVAKLLSPFRVDLIFYMYIFMFNSF